MVEKIKVIALKESSFWKLVKKASELKMTPRKYVESIADNDNNNDNNINEKIKQSTEEFTEDPQ